MNLQTQFTDEEVKYVEEEEKEEIVQEKDTKIYTFDSKFTLDVACADLIAYALKKDFVLDPICTRSLISALASSRLIVINYEEKHFYDKFIEILGQYLGCQIVKDDFDAIQSAGGDVLSFKSEFNSSITLTNVASALMDKSIDDEKIRIMALDNVKSKYIKSYLTHVLKHLDSPEKETEVCIHLDGREERFDIPSNLWFVVSMAQGEKITDIPKFILDTVCVVDLIAWETQEATNLRLAEQEVVKEQTEENDQQTAEQTQTESTQALDEQQPTENAEEKAEQVLETDIQTYIDEIAASIELPEQNVETKTIESVEQLEQAVQEDSIEQIEDAIQEEVIEEGKLSFYQFNKLVSHALRDCLIEENLWKRVDKLEDYVCQKETYRIDNKHWHRIEKYVSSYIAAGGVEEEALDSVVAHHMIYGMLPILANSKDKNEDKFTHVIENIFGEGHAPFSIKVVKSTGMDV